MGQIVAGFGVPHSPHAPEQVRKDPTRSETRLYGRVAEAIVASRADALIVFHNDHFNTFFLNNWPIFAIGVADKTAGPNDPTVMPRYDLPVQTALATQIHQHAVAAGFDLSVLRKFELDHSILVPLHFMPPARAIPIIPIIINSFVPPLPSSQRCFALGQAVRAAVEAFPQPLRVAVLASGHFSLEIGGPQIEPDNRHGVPDPGWTDRVTTLLRDGDIKTLVQEATFQRMQRAGNIGGELLNWIAMLGVTGAGKADWIEEERDEGNSYAFWQLN
jgi:aromatic ring-opening dioxygenase catalytic subunit (LigB family)